MRQQILQKRENRVLKFFDNENIITILSYYLENGVKRVHIPKQIVNYIKVNNLSVSRISIDTGIDEEKLLGNMEPFSAAEFLELCFYLNVRPEDFRK